VSIDKSKSDFVLEEAKLRREKDRIINIEEERVKVVIFTLSGGDYAFYGDEVKEILSHANIFYVPGTPGFIHGVINVRGEIESVINLAAFLGLPDSVKAVNSRILIAAGDEIRSGVLVESVEDVLDIPVNSVKPPLPTLGQSIKVFIAGEFIHSNKTVTLLSVRRIFEKMSV
jgi:purine-binding chemotaxis protein CheW